MSRLIEWPTPRDAALGRNVDSQGFGWRWRRVLLWVAIPISIAALAAATPIGTQAEDAPLGPHFRVKGLPVGVTLSGGRTNAERAWIVPLGGLDNLKVEVPPGLAGDFDLNVALVGDDGVALAERAVELRVKPAVAAAPSSEADAAQRKEAAIGTTSELEPSAATTPSVGRPHDVSVGPHFRIKGLPADVTLSGGYTDDERAWVMPLSDGKRAWMVPLWALDNLKIEIPPGVAGNLDLVVALADNAGGVVVERTIALRVKPVVVAAPSRPEPDVGQRKNAVVATPALPPGGAAPAAPSRSEPDAGQRKYADATTALPPGGAAPAAPSRSEPDAGQRKDALTTPAPRPGGAAPAPSERKCTVVVECQPPAEEPDQAERLARQGDRYLAQGNIAIARQYFARAADLGLAIAALKIAETYDPNELARLNVYGVKPNLAEARRWYQRAFELDVPEAQARMQRLGTR
jgi:hypothetical protein